ncbi:MAG: DUF4363 family protein [Ruminococcus sp.]|nr:DUF4363 family protein [Ruminococcus sp.]
MKRIYIAVILLVFTVLICSVEFIYISSSADKITERIENLCESYKKGNTESSLRYALETEKDWMKKVKRIDMLLYHDYVDEITKNIVNLKTYIAQEDAVGLYSTCNEILTQVSSLKSSELPTAQNII